MSVKLNPSGSSHAASLISSGKIKDSRSWSPPSAAAENAHIEKHGMAEYLKWFLGEDESAAADSKGRAKFPFTSDFENVDYAGLRACITRAAGAGYTSVQSRAKELYEQAGKKLGKDTAKDLVILDAAAKMRIEVVGAFDDDDADDAPVDVLIHEPIGRDENAPPWAAGISSADFARMMDAIPQHKKIVVGLNCMGGLITDGTAMASKIRSMGARVDTRIDGMAGSMASVIHQAGNRRLMMPGSKLGIHNPSMGTMGDYRQHEWATDYLKRERDNLVDLYHARTRLPKSELKEMMDKTTILHTKDAMEKGFCDEVIAGTPCTNSLSDSEIFSRLNGASNRGPAPAVEPPNDPQPNKKQMKKLMTALAEFKLVTSAELTDEQAETAVRGALAALTSENTTLKTENQKFKDERKTRVTNLVTQAINDKLIAESRKESLIALGETNEAEVIAQIADLRAAKATVSGRGARPAPTGTSQQGDEAMSLEELRAEMSDPATTAARKGQLAVLCRKARGHNRLFQQSAPADGGRAN